MATILRRKRHERAKIFFKCDGCRSAVLCCLCCAHRMQYSSTIFRLQVARERASARSLVQRTATARSKNVREQNRALQANFSSVDESSDAPLARLHALLCSQSAHRLFALAESQTRAAALSLRVLLCVAAGSCGRFASVGARASGACKILLRLRRPRESRRISLL